MYNALFGSSTTEATAAPKEGDLTASMAKKEIADEVDDDDFKDAVEEENEEVGEGTFEVTPDELAIIRAELATEFPDDYNYLSDAYILSVASKPYSKDPTVRRPLEVRSRRRFPPCVSASQGVKMMTLVSLVVVALLFSSHSVSLLSVTRHLNAPKLSRKFCTYAYISKVYSLWFPYQASFFLTLLSCFRKWI